MTGYIDKTTLPQSKAFSYLFRSGGFSGSKSTAGIDSKPLIARRKFQGPSLPHSGVPRVRGGRSAGGPEGADEVVAVGVADDACQLFRDVVNLVSAAMSSKHRFKNSCCPVSFCCTISGILSWALMEGVFDPWTVLKSFRAIHEQ